MRTETDSKAGERTQHTPGPWEAHAETREASAHVTYVRSGSVIADVYGVGSDEQEATANARLIAAAPELLEALRQVQIALACVRDRQIYTDPQGRELCLEEVKYCIVDEAIARAEGRNT